MSVAHQECAHFELESAAAVKRLLLALATAGLASTSAMAIPSQCGLGTLTATFADASTAGWTDCTGAWDGNLTPNTAAALVSIINLEFGLTNATLIGKTGDVTNPWSNNPGSVNSGVLNFAAPYGGLFVVGLHAGDQNAPQYPGIPVANGGDFSLYLFDGRGHGGVTSIAFETDGVSVNNHGVGRTLSHAALYGGQPWRPPLVVTNVDTDTPTNVPEPSALALLATALLASTSMSRRRRGLAAA